jgi:hypothetical protein
MFEKASRIPLRFQFKGTISVEELWSLSFKELDSLYKQLSKSVKESTEDSLLTEKSSVDETLDLQMKIVKHVFETLSKEAEERKTATQKKLQKQKILELIERKKEDSMANMSVEDLEKLLVE